MYTQCPGCNTVFRIDVARLRAAGGEVLCQHCHIVFDALAALSETVSAAAVDLSDEAVTSTPATPAPSANQTRDRSALPALGLADAVPSSRYELERGTAGEEDEWPSFNARQRRLAVRHAVAGNGGPQPRKPRGWRFQGLGWALGSLMLLGLLLGQVGLFEGRQLAQHESLRGAVEWLCRPLGCVLPEFRRVDRIRIIDRGLYPAPDDFDGFEFTVVMANQASRPQAYPTLQLTLTEVNGTAIATRRFKAQEYLGSARPGLMAIGEPVEIRLLLARPGREIGGFTFELL